MCLNNTRVNLAKLLATTSDPDERLDDIQGSHLHLSIAVMKCLFSVLHQFYFYIFLNC